MTIDGDVDQLFSPSLSFSLPLSLSLSIIVSISISHSLDITPYISLVVLYTNILQD